MTRDSISSTHIYSKHQFKVAGLLLVSYVAIALLASHFFPAEAGFNPASAIALSSLYFGGLRLWPVVYLAAVIFQGLVGAPSELMWTMPVIEVLQATAGSYLLHAARIDPLFRRYRDTFYFIATTVVIACITPTVSLLVHVVQHIPTTPLAWWHSYIAMVFCFLIATPFILRWFTKPRFSRPWIEVAETVGVFAVLISIDFALFVGGIVDLFGIPLIYILLIPFFWIALRLRPRFVTLALVVTSLFAIVSIEPGAHVEMLQRVFETEIFLITCAISFFIVTSLEEDRRVNTNLMRTQMGTLKNAVERISSESRAKNDFIAILAHELRNPLAPVVSSIDLMKLKTERDQDDMDLLNIMEDRMGVVRRLLDDLLDISRISEGKITVKKESIELAPVIKHAILSTDHHRKELHQRLVVSLPNKPLYVSGDAMRLEQVFSNLLTNASKYSASGDTIKLSMKESGAAALIEISDEGIGLSSHQLEIIFQPFHQVEQGERSGKGLGIGLSLVRDFIHLHGGSIEATSEGSGKGSRFTVRLPLLFKQHLSAEPAASRVPDTAYSAKGAAGAFVLIVDDNDAAAGGIGRLLEFEGCQVAYAYDAKQALEKARNLSPDAIFLDIGLPDQDGFAVAKILRARGYKGRLIALTGYSTEDAKEKGKDAGFDNYLVKPVGIADLRAVLAELTQLAK